MDWKTPQAEDVPLFQKSALANKALANNYSALNSFLYAKKYKALYCVQDGWLFEKYFNGQKNVRAFPHKMEGGAGAEETAFALERLSQEAAECGEPLIFYNVTLEEKDILLEHFSSADSQEAPDRGDYIYLAKNLAELPGKLYSKKRNHTARFAKLNPGFYCEPLCAQNLEAALFVEDQWLLENSQNGADKEALVQLDEERAMIKKALDNFEALSASCAMAGTVLFVQEKPAAFCLASQLSQDAVDVHFEKCLLACAKDGGYAAINQEFAKSVRAKYINREEDLGIEGLRKAKRSYYPEIFLRKFTVRA